MGPDPKAIMAIWCVCFCGMQWRAIGHLSGIPFGTLYTLFARWARPGLWRRLLDRLRRTWRLACGDTPEPSAVVIDSRTCRSAPSCFARRVEGGKKLRGVRSTSPSRSPAPRWPSTPRPPTNTTPRASCRSCASLPAMASRALSWVISAIGASAWPKLAWPSASPFSPLLAAATGPSSQPESAGRWSAPLAGSLSIGG